MGDSRTEFTTRRFTITHALDDALVALAQRHYQGNVSLCLRTAIESHRETLNGRGPFAAHKAAAQLEALQDQQHELLTTLTDQPDTTHPTSDSTGWGSGMMDDPTSHAILQTLDDAGHPLRLPDLLEAAELNPSTTHDSLAFLVDRGFVTKTQTQPPRYVLAGYGGLDD